MYCICKYISNTVPVNIYPYELIKLSVLPHSVAPVQMGVSRVEVRLLHCKKECVHNQYDVLICHKWYGPSPDAYE